ncbi:hypothetical protein [Streptomyces sp. NRRL F-5053]|uniref:hypothetical protein n=1 Tax=Streptomyces sp. NRRL F-5053 TaxID=1463854 RepID=UPI0004C6B55F|nr:hypothetical protein [Streptomyces sp. NRRL F-5053]
MANYSVSASQLTEGTNVFIRGKLAFARLTSLIDGAELAASDQRKIQNGMSPVGKPHTTATITNAEVVYADPAHPTVEEQFVSERRYTSKRNPDTGAHYSIDSKGTNLPIIAIPSKSGDGTFDQDSSGQELAKDLDVTLVLRVFKPANFANRGLALEQVIVNEPPRYYTAGVSSDELAARGIVFNAPPKAVQARPGASDSAAGATEELVGTAIDDGLPLPAPQPSAPAPGAAATSAQAQTVPGAEPQTGESDEMSQLLARLQAENEELKSGSAVGTRTPQGPQNPASADDQHAGITYQG